jgi:voltage-gated potassium channel
MLFQGVFQGALGELTLLGTVTGVLVVAGTVVLYLVEHDHAPFSELTEAMWFSLFSLVAGEPVGGDPKSTLGRVVTLMLMFGGLTIFGMFIGTISASMVSRISKREGIQEFDIDEQSDHVVVCGWNRTGAVVLQELFGHQRNQAVVLITELAQLPADIPSTVVRRELLYHVSGDFTKIDALERANIREAAAAIVLSDSLTKRSDQDRDARTVLAAMTIERLRPGIYTCAELRNRENGSMLKMLGVDEIVVPEEYGGVILGSASRNRGMMQVLDEILSVRYGNSFHKVAVPQAWIGRSVRAVFVELKEKHDAILVSVEVTREGQRRVTMTNPALDYVLEIGSALFVIAPRPIEL